MEQNKFKTILLGGLVAGALDALAAIFMYITSFDLHKISMVFRYIASTIFEEAMTAPGIVYPAIGLLIHFLIATAWTAIYLIFFFPAFKPGSVVIKIIMFAATVWVGMNGIALTIAGLSSRYNGLIVLKTFAAILVCVSLPICLIVEKKYVKKIKI